MRNRFGIVNGEQIIVSTGNLTKHVVRVIASFAAALAVCLIATVVWYVASGQLVLGMFIQPIVLIPLAVVAYPLMVKYMKIT